ncbi:MULTISPECIES: hypothetical protein [Geomicrobium]|uniref:Uncharacterized protein n=1 Tax=Geomicrobium sediminis TaxID=1347788 RepID=A0ABS2P9G2_9BACL|nr:MULTISPECIES: hypothetical protein [Geomicrobium]MBM7631952.1 hypothetical protein [Geomicrobium sediminis]GAK00443.1 hypothetical protein JCM19055_3530 [Geomicrobium sp. JCM 19055]GAK08593.1 hypothetical protein JCM19038_2379 [Geomicrobium sp. JCM 19038]
MGAILFGAAVFVGWTLIDLSKHKELKKENVLGSLFVAIIAAIGWAVFDLIL